jgi:hypothetical protein
MSEEAIDYWGESRVEGISFTGDRPAKLATKVRAKMEKGHFLLPDDPEVRRDLHMVRRTYTDLGKVRFEAPRTKDGHADRFWGAALAINAADDAPVSMKGAYKSGGLASQWIGAQPTKPTSTFHTPPARREAQRIVSRVERSWKGY